MKKHSYYGIQSVKILYSQLIGIMGMLFSTLFALLMLSGITRVTENQKTTTIMNDPRLALVCIALWFIVIGWLVGMMFINFYPTIWIADQGIEISFCIFFRILIKWENIIDLGTGSPPKGCILVRARKITPFHRIYGWSYSFTFFPSFLIGKGISERDALISEIVQHILLQHKI